MTTHSRIRNPITIILLSLVFCLQGCNNQLTGNVRNSSSLFNTDEITSTNIKIKAESLSKYPYMKRPVLDRYLWEDIDQSDLEKAKYKYTLDRPTNVFNSPVGKSIIYTLPPFTKIRTEREGIEPKTQKKWYYIRFKGKTGKQLKRTIFGYILETNISIGNIGDKWILGKEWMIGDSSTNEALPYFSISYISRDNKADTIIPSKVLSLTLNKVLEDITYYNGFSLSEMETALKDAPRIANLYWHHGESCPESEGNVFIVENNSKLIVLPKYVITGEYGYYDYRKVYIPVKLSNGEIVLGANGDPNEPFAYPKGCNIPIDQLIIEEEASEEGIRDDEGKILEDKKGQPIMEKTSQTIRYYRWTGDSVKMEKEIVYKN